MNSRRKLRKEERRQLQIKSQRMLLLVNKILQEEFKRRIFNMKREDQYRLLILDGWRQKYKVSVRFILSRLIPYYQSRVNKWQKRRYTDGLGIRVATLVGAHSEQILKETIDREYPNGENIEEWRWKKRIDILEQRDKDNDDGIKTREKTLADFGRPERYMKYYQKKTKRNRQGFSKELLSEANKKRAYRDNPWL